MLFALLVVQLSIAKPRPCNSLPLGIVRAIEQRWPGAHVPDSSIADSAWKDNVGHGFYSDGHPFCVTANLDGNGLRDYAMILQDSAGLRIIAFHRTRTGYVPHVMMDRLDGDTLSHFSLFRIGPMTHQDQIEGGPTFRTRHDAIEVVDDDTSSWTLVWDGRKYRTYWTSD